MSSKSTEEFRQALNNACGEINEAARLSNDIFNDVRELILTQQLTVGDRRGWLIERWDWRDDFWQPTSGSFVEQLPDGTQEDHPINVGLNPTGESNVLSPQNRS